MLNLHPTHLAAAYDFLRALPPFNRWKLPPGEECHFHVSASADWHAEYQHWSESWGKEAGHHIRVSAKRTQHTLTLVMNMAHEMIHLKQKLHKTETSNTQHNAEFHHLAARVCQIHGWDPGQF